MLPILYIITGPTAVGKTDLAIAWAEAHEAEIISCDSLLVYQGMDIGTAKPSPEQLRRVPHHGIDLVPVRQQYYVGAYLEMAQAAVADILRRGKQVVIVGGSGFYLKSFFAPVIDNLEISPSIKKWVSDLHRREGVAGLRREFSKLNPAGESDLDLNNPRRLRNALERCLTSGKTVQELRRAFARKRSPFDRYEKRVCCLMRERMDLRERVRERVLRMLSAGLVDEIKELLKAGIEENPSAVSAIGYGETIAYLKEGGSREELAATIAQATMGLIKKQLTWFKKQLPINQSLSLKEAVSGEIGAIFA